MSKPVYFPSAAAWRRWLAAHHDREREILVGYHKVATGRPSLTWQESVDEALCFGWIDGVRRSVDETRYCIRFTPRREHSTWSAVNIRRVAELEAAGRMQLAGRAAFARRRAERSEQYAYENRPATLDEPYRTLFRRHAAAWQFFESQPPGYRRTCIWWIVSAKREATRLQRLTQLINDSAAGRRLGMPTPSPAKRTPKTTTKTTTKRTAKRTTKKRS